MFCSCSFKESDEFVINERAIDFSEEIEEEMSDVTVCVVFLFKLLLFSSDV